MSVMKDRNGKIIHHGELITIVNRPEFILHEYWSIFDFIENKDVTKFILRNCVTNEFEIVLQENIQRMY